jgi:hypothetical protein
MKRLILIFIIIVLGTSCEIEKVSSETKLQCSVQLTTLLLPVGNSKTKEVRGIYTSDELVRLLSGYDMYLVNCVSIK